MAGTKKESFKHHKDEEAQEMTGILVTVPLLSCSLTCTK